MIKFGATYGLLPDPYGMLANQMQAYLSSEMRCVMAPRVSVHRGSNLIYLNYPELPRPAVNRLVIPTGATRWSYMYMLVTGTQKTALYTEAAGGPLTLQYRTEKRSEVGARRTIKMKMWPLQALPISPEIVNSNREHVTFDPRFGEAASVAAGLDTSSRPESLYLIPLVDGRYWWQYRNVGAISAEEFADAAALVEYLETKSGSTIDVNEIHADYDQVPAVLDNDNENLATVLDSVAWQLGLTVCPNMEGDGDKFVLLDGETSSVIHSDNMAGVNQVMGESAEDTGYPVGVMGDELDTEIETSAAIMPASVVVMTSETESVLVTASTAGYHRKVIAGASLVLKYQWFGSVSATLALRIAKDFYARYLVQYDRTFVGSQQWQPCSFADVIVHEMNGLTRIRSIPPNLMPEMVCCGDGGSHYFWFTVDEFLCPGDSYDFPLGGLIVTAIISSTGKAPIYSLLSGSYYVRDILGILDFSIDSADFITGSVGRCAYGVPIGEAFENGYWILDSIRTNPDCGA